jgi:hypothetical protein
MTFVVEIISIFSQSTIKMCNTCSLGQVKFTTPITLDELNYVGTNKFIRRCQECDEHAFVISKFRVPSLISCWKILTPTSQQYEPNNNVVYNFRLIV